MKFQILSKKAIYSIVISAWVTLVFGLLLPCYSVVPSVGGGLGDDFFKDLGFLKVEHYSIASSVFALLCEAEATSKVIGVVIGIFSIVLPAFKLSVITRSSFGARSQPSWLQSLSNWGMLDIFAVAIVVVGSRSFPLGTRIIPQVGILIFCLSVLLTMIAGKISSKGGSLLPQGS